MLMSFSLAVTFTTKSPSLLSKLKDSLYRFSLNCPLIQLYFSILIYPPQNIFVILRPPSDIMRLSLSFRCSLDITILTCIKKASESIAWA